MSQGAPVLAPVSGLVFPRGGSHPKLPPCLEYTVNKLPPLFHTPLNERTRGGEGYGAGQPPSARPPSVLSAFLLHLSLGTFKPPVAFSGRAKRGGPFSFNRRLAKFLFFVFEGGGGGTASSTVSERLWESQLKREKGPFAKLWTPPPKFP